MEKMEIRIDEDLLVEERRTRRWRMLETVGGREGKKGGGKEQGIKGRRQKAEMG